MKINPKDLQQIIKEEAMRLKRKMMLESEKESIVKRLNEMQECEMMEDAAMGGMAPEMGAGASEEVQIKPNVASTIDRNAQVVLSKLSPEMLSKTNAELQAAGLTGSEDQIKSKVAEMLPMNESMINEAWDKSKIYNWLVGSGLGATVAGVVTMVLGSMPTQQLSNLADYTGATVHPGPAVIAGLIALAIGAIGAGIGMVGNQKLATDKGKMSPEQAAKIIAQRKATRGR
jgi:hypothetical protein